jgi:tetrahydromethanopterin S-methyltransferase subunit G
MPIAAVLLAEAEIRAMKKEMGEMWKVIKEQKETIRVLGVEQSNAITQKDLMVVMVTKAEHTSTERRLRELREDVDRIVPLGSAGRTLADMLGQKASIEDFAQLDKRLVEVRTQMETTAGDLFGKLAARLERSLEGKASIEDVRSLHSPHSQTFISQYFFVSG